MSMDLDFDSYSTNNVSNLVKSLYLLQRMPGCEKEAESIADKLHNEFMQFPESKDKNKLPCRIVDKAYRYYPGGLVNSNSQLSVVLKPWKYENKPVAKPKKSPSYVYLKNINALWYVQVMLYKKRKPSIPKTDKFDYVQFIKNQTILNAMTEEDREHIDKDKMMYGAENTIRQIHYLLGINKDMLLRWGNDNAPDFPKSFFFLTDVECEALCQAMENDGLTASSSREYHRCENLSDTIYLMLDKPPKERQWIIRPELGLFTYQETVKHTYIEDRYYERSVLKHDELWSHFEEEFDELSDEHKNVLSHYVALT